MSKNKKERIYSNYFAKKLKEGLRQALNINDAYYVKTEQQIFDDIVNAFELLFINGHLDKIIYSQLANNASTTYSSTAIYMIQYVQIDKKVKMNKNYFGQSNLIRKRRFHHVNKPHLHGICSNLYILLTPSQAVNIINGIDSLKVIIDDIIHILLNYFNHFNYYHPFIISVLSDPKNEANKEKQLNMIRSSLAISLLESYIAIFYGHNLYTLEKYFQIKLKIYIYILINMYKKIMI